MTPDQATQANGLPKMSDIYSNIQAPSTSDLGGSLGDKATGINSGTNNAYGAYQGQMAGAGSTQNPFSTYQDLLKQNGIPQLQRTQESLAGNVNDLESALDRVQPNVSANTGNSLVTEGQRAGMVSGQQGQLNLQLNPILRGLDSVNNNINTQEQNIGNEVSAVGQNNSLLSDAGKLGVSVAQDNAARSMTGYTQDASNMLDGLLKKMDIQGTLDQAEWQTLSQLATQKQAYQQQLGTIAAQQKYQLLGPGVNLVNTQTNQAVNPSMLTSRTGMAKNI